MVIGKYSSGDILKQFNEDLFGERGLMPNIRGIMHMVRDKLDSLSQGNVSIKGHNIKTQQD